MECGPGYLLNSCTPLKNLVIHYLDFKEITYDLMMIMNTNKYAILPTNHERSRNTPTILI